jgi:hypothetical protein
MVTYQEAIMGYRPSRLLAVVALLCGFLALGTFAAAADDKPAQKVKVFVFAATDTAGFVDERTTDLRDSLKDIREAILKKNDWLELVEGREQADVVLQLTDRKLVEREGTLQTTTTTDNSGKRSTSTTTRTKEHDVVLNAVMTVGDYKNDLTGRCDLGYLFGGAYRQAAKNLVGSLENWVKKNYTQLQLRKTR